MLPYFMLLILPFIYNVTVQAIFNHGRVNLIHNRKDYKSPIVMVFFIYLAIVLMFREKSVGLDLDNYHYMFNKYSLESIRTLLTSDGELLYKILNWLIGKFTNEFQWVLAITALMAIIPIFCLYNEDKKNGYMKIALFINTSVFVVLFSALRQSIAVAIGVCAYYFVRKHKFIPFLIVIVIANMFHHSAFILIAMYPIYHMRLNSKHLWMVIPVFVIVLFFREGIFNLISELLANFYDKYERTITNTGALATFLLYVIFLVYSYVLPDERRMNEELIGLRNFLLVATILQSFAGLNALSMRMNYYYIVFIPYAMCKFVEIPKKEFRRVATVSKCVLCIFFTLYFIMTVISSYGTKNLLGIVPYDSVWR